MNDLLIKAIPKRNLFLDALAANVRSVYIEPDNSEYVTSHDVIVQILSPKEESSDDEYSGTQTTDGDTLALAGQPSEINLDKVRIDLGGHQDSAMSMSSFTSAR